MWRGLDSQRWEVAHFKLNQQGVAARGTQIGTEPVRYRMDYELDARGGFVTRQLNARAEGEGWSRRLVLQHDGRGAWTCDVEASGQVDLDTPAAERGVLDELTVARDCDLGFSPATNLMPIRRHRLNLEDGAADIVVAWVSVPDLKLYAYAQRYESIRRTTDGSLVRFIDRGLSEGFVANLRLDADGLIELYPDLAECVG
ncbi:MAG: putative glycolipid-binding domain-containing protein [Actinomycetota bacterium]|nr:putative glycolipid-binding domain-containing protein [Actinomycetota bacterium]